MTPPTTALAGFVALAVAMVIGRFAFTPLLPMMLAERSVDLTGASLLASTNYPTWATSLAPWPARSSPGYGVAPGGPAA